MNKTPLSQMLGNQFASGHGDTGTREMVSGVVEGPASTMIAQGTGIASETVGGYEWGRMSEAEQNMRMFDAVRPNQSPLFDTPNYGSPSMTTPDYSAPNYGSPSHSSPGYSAPNYGSPSHSSPGYSAPNHAPASHSSPGYAPADYGPPQDQGPNYAPAHYERPGATPMQSHAGAGMHSQAPVVVQKEKTIVKIVEKAPSKKGYSSSELTDVCNRISGNDLGAGNPLTHEDEEELQRKKAGAERSTGGGSLRPIEVPAHFKKKATPKKKISKEELLQVRFRQMSKDEFSEAMTSYQKELNSEDPEVRLKAVCKLTIAGREAQRRNSL